jgi:hypothetical protein
MAGWFVKINQVSMLAHASMSGWSPDSYSNDLQAGIGGKSPFGHFLDNFR